MCNHVRVTRLSFEQAYAAGRMYALDHARAPCSSYLVEAFNLDACSRQHFVNGFRVEKAAWPFSSPVDLRRRECRCSKGWCDDLPYPYFGA